MKYCVTMSCVGFVDVDAKDERKRWKLPNLMILKRLIGIHMTFALNVVRQK